MSLCINMSCCNAGQTDKTSITSSTDGLALCCDVTFKELDVAAGDVYVYGQVVTLNGITAIAPTDYDLTGEPAQKVGFIVASSCINASKLVSDNAGTPLTQAELDALMPTFIPREVA